MADKRWQKVKKWRQIVRLNIDKMSKNVKMVDKKVDKRLFKG